MARLFNDAASEYLVLASAALVTNEPFTMAGWFNSDDTTLNQVVLSVSDTDGTGYWRLVILNAANGQVIRAHKKENGTDSDVADTSTQWSANVWQHAAAVFASDTSRSVYLNGGGKATTTTNTATDPVVDNTAIGVMSEGLNPRGFFSGLIAEAAIWSIDLTDGEIKMLAAGVSPLRVRPASIVAYWPLPAFSGDAIDYSGNGNTLTDTNTVGVADHAPVAPMFGFVSSGLFLVGGASAALEAAVSVSLSATTALTTAIQLAGVVSLTLTPAAALTTDIQLAAAVSTSISTTAALTTDITMAGSVTASVTASGTLTITYVLTGVTKDAGGNPLGTCECFLFKDNLDNTVTFLKHTQSDISGNYSFTGITDNDAQYFVVAWKDDAPHVFDVTDHILQPAAG